MPFQVDSIRVAGGLVDAAHRKECVGGFPGGPRNGTGRNAIATANAICRCVDRSVSKDEAERGYVGVGFGDGAAPPGPSNWRQNKSARHKS